MANLLPVGGRRRPHAISNPTGRPRSYRWCPSHPKRIVPIGVPLHCWLCEKKDAEFAELDRLIALGLGSVRQEQITITMLRRAERGLPLDLDLDEDDEEEIAS